jgi:hypothetical protein
MTRRDWWLGILVLVAALFAFGAANRYTYQLYTPLSQGGRQVLLKIDRVTGAVLFEPVPPVIVSDVYAQTASDSSLPSAWP